MGTRSITKFYDKYDDGTTRFIGGIYRQCDGYLEGHGKDLKDYLKNKKIINGICDETLATAFNGMSCCGAAVIAHFKKRIGGIYLSTENDKEFYNYKVWPEKDKIFIEIQIGDNIFYSGHIDDMPEEE